jgi:hypothetical protein
MLQIAHSVFKRWRPKFRTDELFSEIKYVLEIFCQPYLILFQVLPRNLNGWLIVQQVDELITKNSSDATALKVLFDTLQLLLKLYVDLNCQDIPEFFEDNMNPFMAIFHKYLTYNNPLLITDVFPPLDVLDVRTTKVPVLWKRQKQIFARSLRFTRRNMKTYSQCFQILSILPGHFSPPPA